MGLKDFLTPSYVPYPGGAVPPGGCGMSTGQPTDASDWLGFLSPQFIAYPRPSSPPAPLVPLVPTPAVMPPPVLAPPPPPPAPLTDAPISPARPLMGERAPEARRDATPQTVPVTIVFAPLPPGIVPLAPSAPAPTTPTPAPCGCQPAPCAPTPSPAVPTPPAPEPAPCAPTPSPVVPTPPAPEPTPCAPAPSPVPLPPCPGDRVLYTYAVNPRLRARQSRAHEQFLEQLVDENVSVRMLTKDGTPITFTTPAGYDSVEFFAGPIEVDPFLGCEGDADEIVTLGPLKLEWSAAPGSLSAGDPINVVVPWRHASWVEMAAGHLRGRISARFYRMNG